MKKERNELIEFLVGACMLAAGLYFFSNKVTVTMGFFGGLVTIGGYSVTSGLTIIPLIAGIVWMFINPDSFGAKLLTVIGAVIIIAAIVASTQFRLVSLTLYEWIIYLVLIFGGFALVARVLFAEPKKKDVE